MASLMRNGAKISKPHPKVAPLLDALEKEKTARAQPVRDQSFQDAYALARANPHKPWARRWLRANGMRFKV